jgi:hypothetical protein
MEVKNTATGVVAGSGAAPTMAAGMGALGVGLMAGLGMGVF